MPQPAPKRYCPARELPRRETGKDSAPRGDWLGNPLPGGVPEPDKWGDSEAWLFAVDLWNGGYVGEASEVLEGMWRSAKGVNPLLARFLQGLIMIAGSAIHRSRGNAGPAAGLVQEGLLKLASVRAEAGAEFLGIGLDGFISAIERSPDTLAPLCPGTSGNNMAPG